MTRQLEALRRRRPSNDRGSPRSDGSRPPGFLESDARDADRLAESLADDPSQFDDLHIADALMESDVDAAAPAAERAAIARLAWDRARGNATAANTPDRVRKPRISRPLTFALTATAAAAAILISVMLRTPSGAVSDWMPTDVSTEILRDANPGSPAASTITFRVALSLDRPAAVVVVALTGVDFQYRVTTVFPPTGAAADVFHARGWPRNPLPATHGSPVTIPPGGSDAARVISVGSVTLLLMTTNDERALRDDEIASIVDTVRAAAKDARSDQDVIDTLMPALKARGLTIEAKPVRVP